MGNWIFGSSSEAMLINHFSFDDDCLLACCAVQSVRSTITTLMMETVSTSETSVNFYQTARRNIPEDSHLLTVVRT
jgi:hypothetical protein